MENVQRFMYDTLGCLWKRGADFLGTKYSVMGGAMSWLSERNLVSAISNNGGFGVLACGSMMPDQLKEEILATRSMTNMPFGVNLVAMHPMLRELVATCQDCNVSHVVLAAGLPKRELIEQLKSSNIKLMCFAPSLAIARKLIKMGVDSLIIEGMEAGGHIGPVSTCVLAQEILPNIDAVPVFVAGGIGRGEAIVQYLHMGAAGCQLGTRFVCAKESVAHNNFKQVFIRSNSRDAVASVQLDDEFQVVPVRAIANNATKEFMAVQKKTIEMYRNRELTKEEAQLSIERFWVGALKRAVIDGDIENGSLMAGQSVGFVNKEQTAEEILEELVLQALNYLARFKEVA
jgi:enoyl-[acyl-carrier protein] reductase II